MQSTNYASVHTHLQPLSYLQQMRLEAELSYSHDEHDLFDNVNIKLKNQQLLIVQGPNGCGKTTLLRLLAGLNSIQTGFVRWNNVDIKKNWLNYQSQQVYIGHGLGLKGHLTPLENLQLICSLKQNKTVKALQAEIKQAGLNVEYDRFTHHLSAGQQRRLSLARLLILPCILWILDEPLAALDSQGVKWVEELLLAHLARGGMAIITTHQPLNISNVDSQILSLGT